MTYAEVTAHYSLWCAARAMKDHDEEVSQDLLDTLNYRLSHYNSNLGDLFRKHKEMTS